MNKWYNFRFRILTLENESPRWWVDIFIMDTIARKVLLETKILLWRFHRRTGIDETGHQLTFHCYTDDALAESINESIKQSGEFNFLQRHRLLRIYYCDEAVALFSQQKYNELLEKFPHVEAVLKPFKEVDEQVESFKKPKNDMVYIYCWEIPDVKKKELGNETINEIMKHAEEAKQNIEDTSDKTWSVELQKSWPYYINGVSQMLLELMRHLKTQVPGKMPSITSNPPLNEVESFYIDLNNRLMAAWQNEGSHAFFHHINALFGHVPLIAQPRTITGMFATF